MEPVTKRDLFHPWADAPDPSLAPWMAFALGQEGREIREHEDYASLESLWFRSITQHEVESGMFEGRRISEGAGGPEEPAAQTPEGGAGEPDPVTEGRPWAVVPKARGMLGWGATAWSAAFVNWCLKQAGDPHLGVATARSWLRFGTALPEPMYGCVAIIPPSKSIGGLSPQVAFYLGARHGQVELLGGGPRNTVARACYTEVVGYRWPTSFNRYLLSKKPGAAVSDTKRNRKNKRRREP